jgi:monoamine oxidase
MVGMEVCSMHGGKSLKGVASATFKHGRYSKYMPQGMSERFREALADPALLALDKDVALVETRLTELFCALKEPGGAWSEVIAWKEKLLAARRSNDAAALGEAFNGLVAAITNGAGERERWAEIGDLIEGRRKVIDSIRKHEVQAQEVLTLGQAMGLFTALAQAVKQNVHDRESLRRISDQFQRLMAGQDRGRVLEAAARVEA